jgi:hypothetical protein
MTDVDEKLAEMKEFLDSPEGQVWVKKMKEKMRIEEEFKSRWIEKFKQWVESDIDAKIQKLLTKYYSDEYVNREYSIGCEPRETLLWLAFDYAQKYCEVCDEEKYLNDFTASAYYIGSYVIQVMVGQGSVIKITEQY